MRVLIFGGDGMAGHVVARTLEQRHDVIAVTRRDATERLRSAGVDCKVRTGVDVRDSGAVTALLDQVKPDVIVNCAGIVKQRDTSNVELLEVNSVFPHRLADLGTARGSRLIHLSTDCVFSGRRGAYRESDIPDPVDLYGVSKLAGEVGAPALTIRTSIIGLELHRGGSLIEWALRQRQLRGYTRAMFSGVTTAELGRVLEHVIEHSTTLQGVFHVAARPISKYDLLRQLLVLLERDVPIEPDDEVVIDRTLDGSAFAAAADYTIIEWPAMLTELVQEIRKREELT